MCCVYKPQHPQYCGDQKNVSPHLRHSRGSLPFKSISAQETMSSNRVKILNNVNKLMPKQEPWLRLFRSQSCGLLTTLYIISVRTLSTLWAECWSGTGTADGDADVLWPSSSQYLHPPLQLCPLVQGWEKTVACPMFQCGRWRPAHTWQSAQPSPAQPSLDFKYRV